MALDFALPKLLWLPFPFTFAEIGLQLALFLRPLQHSLLPSLSGAVENSSVCMWKRRGQGLHDTSCTPCPRLQLQRPVPPPRQAARR